MQRRDLLRLLGGVPLLAGVSADDLLALGTSTHARLAASEVGIGFFDAHQMHTVAAAGDRIIPITETPGAMAAECHRFTERIVADHYDATRQRRFTDGLADLDARASAMHGRLFIQGTPTEQDAVLTAVEEDAHAAGVNTAQTFWRDLKYLTIYGYYTSEIGIEEELQTNRYPGYYDGCVPIEEAR